MPLWLLGPLVVVGIALVVFLVKRTGGDAPPMFADGDAAARMIRAEFPSIVPAALKTCEAGRAAVFQSGDGGVGVIRQIGRNSVGRKRMPGEFTISRQGKALRIALHDAGFPDPLLEFDTEEEARAFADRITRSVAGAA